MSDEPKLEIARKEADSSSALLPPRSAIVARGRRDAAALKAQSVLIDKAIAEFRAEMHGLAEQGNPIAQSLLGTLYHDGEGGPQSYAEAARWWRKAADSYRKAAEQGHADAQNNVGDMYRDGEGVPQDYAEAARWYRSAAEQGLADAQFNLGSMYKTGQGVPRDSGTAYFWFYVAAATVRGEDEKKFSKERDAVAVTLTLRKIAEAQRLARGWTKARESAR